MENCPLARAYKWRAPRDKQARSLEWHLERDTPKKLTGPELTEFQKERARFHRQRAERVGNGEARRGEAPNSGTHGRRAVVQEAAS